MPVYALLFRNPAIEDPELRSTEGWARQFDEFVAWAEALERRGKLRGVERLAGPSRIVRREGGRLVADGPFAETKETVLGFFLVEVADVEEALAIAEEAPLLATGGSVEVRETGDFPRPGGRP